MIATEHIHALRALSARAETQGQLTPEQLAVVYDHGWFKAFVPRSYGGLELTFPAGVRLEEELAWIDGSLGWTITLCAGANLFVGYLDPSVAQVLFSNRTVCLGGSGQASGRAVREKGGYRISGKWRYATGAPHLTHFTANCLIDDTSVVKSFFFAKGDVHVEEDWPAFGLKATASHSFSVSDHWVSKSHAFDISPEYATLPQLIYRYPFLQFAEATLAANTLGMARHFILCAAEFVKTDSAGKLAKAQQLLADVRASFYAAVDASWGELTLRGDLSLATSQAVSNQSRALVRLCREQVIALYPHVGLVAANPTTEINRIWRDLFTASQHSLLR